MSPALIYHFVIKPFGVAKLATQNRNIICGDKIEEIGAVSALNSSSCNHQWIWLTPATTLSKVSSSVGYCFQTQQVAHHSPAGPSAVPRLVVLAAAALGPGPVEVLVRTRQPPGSSVLVVHFLRAATISLSTLCHQVSTSLSCSSTAQNSSLLYLTAPLQQRLHPLHFLEPISMSFYFCYLHCTCLPQSTLW